MIQILKDTYNIVFKNVLKFKPISILNLEKKEGQRSEMQLY